jgi:hypothetical protein
MTKVYVATEGSYSDYRILGVFTTEEEASKVGDYAEEYDLWERVPTKKTVYVLMAFPPDYAPRPIEVHLIQPWDYGYGLFGVAKRPKYELFPNRGFRVSGTDRPLVEKAFQDRRAQLIAEAEGIA